jgi:hypothetical protein
MPVHSFPFREWLSIEMYVQYYTQINQNYTYTNAYEPFLYLFSTCNMDIFPNFEILSEELQIVEICNREHSSRKFDYYII